VNDDPAGEPAPDPEAAGDHLTETPAVGIARRELRTGWRLLGVAAAALALGVVVEVLIFPVPNSVWHAVPIAAVVFGGMLTIQGTSKIRNGRATLRDELRRQSEAPPAGGAGHGE
jgi:hypothetical protein